MHNTKQQDNKLIILYFTKNSIPLAIKVNFNISNEIDVNKRVAGRTKGVYKTL